MASILDRYGIKEVADVTFYKIKNDGARGDPVLYLDTLKVSTIEQTAESVDARGGKGNPKLVTWDYGKEITVSIEDALFSAKSMAIMFGNGTVTQTTATAGDDVIRSATVRATTTKLPDYFMADIYSALNGSERVKLYMGSADEAPSGMTKFANQVTITGVFNEDGTELKSDNSSITTAALWQGATAVAGNKYIVQYTVKVIGKTISVSADSFPGTYYVQGDTYARSDVDGHDQFFQFIIPKAKVTSENTITLEAEGDPAVFNMNLTVLRPEDGEMMKLVQYDLKGE